MGNVAAKTRAAVMPVGFTRSGRAIWPQAGGASPLQVANPAQQRVSRNPQTTAPPVAGGPFPRQTRVSRLFGFSAAPAFGELVASSLKPVPGYLSYLDVTVVASGGTGVAAVAAADAPFSVIRNVQVIDAFGNPIASYSGFELALLNVYGGQGGFFSPLAGGNYVPVMTTSGNFSFHIVIPFELFAGFCSIPAANASAVPNLRIQMGSLTDVYATNPTGTPTLSVTVEECYNSIGLTNPNAEPPDNGASHQWFSQPAPQGIGSAGIIDSQLPPLGGWMTTLILTGRDSLGARADAVLASALSTQTALWIDNVPEFQELFGTRKAWMDDFFEIPTTAQVGADMRTGVVVYTYRNAAATFGPINALDTGDGWVDTNPGTIVQYKSTSGVIANAPGKLTALSGRVYTPSGIPYTHLSE